MSNISSRAAWLYHDPALAHRFYVSLYRTSPWTCTSANSGEIHDCHLTKSRILRSWLSGQSTSSWYGCQTHSLWMKRLHTFTRPLQRTSFWGYCTRGTYSGPLGTARQAINGKHLNAAMYVCLLWKCLHPPCPLSWCDGHGKQPGVQNQDVFASLCFSGELCTLCFVKTV